MTTAMSRHELSNDILLMTTALEGLQIGKPFSAATKSNTHDIFQAFATLLIITTPHDPSASNVLAVTGTVDSDSIKAFVVTRDAGTKPFDVFSKPTPAERAQNQVVMQNLANIYECVYYHPHTSILLIYNLRPYNPELSVQTFICWISSLFWNCYGLPDLPCIVNRASSMSQARYSSDLFTTVLLRRYITVSSCAPSCGTTTLSLCWLLNRLHQ